MKYIDIKFKDKGLVRWLRNEPKRRQALRNMLADIAEKGEKYTKDEARDIAGSPKGNLRKSIVGTTRRNRAIIYGAMYGDIALEYGRRPGKMPPVKALERWAEFKLGDSRLAYAVARKIAEKGTQKHQRGGPRQLTIVQNKLIRKAIYPALNKLLKEYSTQ